MNIPQPEFDLYEFVTIHWNGKNYPTQIKQRLFDPEEDLWFYKVSLNLPNPHQLVISSNLSHR